MREKKFALKTFNLTDCMIQWTERFHSKNRIQAIKQYNESHNDNVNEKILHQHCSNNLGIHFLLYQVTELARPVPIRRQQSLYDGSFVGMGAKFMELY